MSATTIINRKGQITIPKTIRDELGLKAGHRLVFTVMPDMTVIIRAKNKSIEDVAGILYGKNRPPLPVSALSR